MRTKDKSSTSSSRQRRLIRDPLLDIRPRPELVYFGLEYAPMSVYGINIGRCWRVARAEFPSDRLVLLHEGDLHIRKMNRAIKHMPLSECVRLLLVRQALTLSDLLRDALVADSTTDCVKFLIDFHSPPPGPRREKLLLEYGSASPVVFSRTGSNLIRGICKISAANTASMIRDGQDQPLVIQALASIVGVAR